MSTTIDQRVVEMRFDNKHFENNVATTMSTLDKLKQKLHLDGATKGLENVNNAAKNVKMDGLGSAVETVSAKFSALQVVGVTALVNITNSAINAGKRIVSALTIDPVKAGLSEYETKMGSIQTILANTEHQGTTLDDVTAALEELNLYADKTIYNFQEMTRNIGTFTAAGVDLDTSVKSIQGIANLAAISGSTSQQASTAMYQLSQALSTGTVKLMDWNSVVNAGMGGKVFQNALIRTAAMLDGAAQDVEAWQAKNVDAYGSFRDSLTEGAWLTSEVLTETLKQFTMSAEKGTEEWEAFKKSLMEQGYSDAQAEEILKMANTASDAATKVKTFTQLFDTLKETAQSGWAQTWELIFGDFEEAKEFFTGLSDMLGGLLNSMSEYRNGILGGALDSNWDKLTTKIREAGHKTTEFEEALRKAWVASGKTEDELDGLIETHGSLEKAIRASDNASEILKKALEMLGLGASGANGKIAGFVEGLQKIERILGFGSVGDDVKSLQTALEALGFSVGKCKIDGIIGPDTTEAIKKFQKEVGIAVDGIAGPETIAALEKAGKKLENITGEASEADASYDELINNITKKGGRELFLEGFSNIINGLVGTFRALGSAWAEIFPAQDAQSSLFKALEGFNKFTQSLRLFEEETDESGKTVIKFNDNGKKLIRTFKGVFAILDMVTTVISGGLKIAFKIVSSVLGYFNLNILDVTAAIGDAAVKVQEWFDSLFDVSGILDKIGPVIKSAAKAIGNWFDAFKKSEGMQKTIEYIKSIGTGIKNWWAGLKDAEDLPKTIAEGIVNFFSSIPKIISTVGSNIWDAITSSFSGGGKNPLGGFISKIRSGLKIAGQTVAELGKILLGKLNTFLSARGFQEISEDSIAGLVNGFKNGAKVVWDVVIGMAKTILEKVKAVLGIHSPSTEFAEVGTNIIDGLVQGIQNGVSKLWETIKSIFTKIVEWVKKIDFGAVIAGAIGIGVVSACNKIANTLEGFGGLGEAIGDIVESAGRVVNSFSKVLNGISWKLKAEAVKEFAIALAVLVGAIAVMAYVCGDDRFNVWEAVGVIAVLSAVLIGIAGATALMSKSAVEIDKNGAKISNLTNGLLGIGLALLLVALTVKLIAGMDPEAAKQGFLGLAGVIAAIGAVLLACKLFVKGDLAGNMDKIGKTVFKISVAMLLLVWVAKLIAGMEWGDMGKATIGIMGLIGMITLLMQATKLAGANADKIGGTILKISIAMLLLVGVAKLIAGMSWEEMGKAAVGMSGLVGIIAALVLVTKLAGNGVNKIAGTILGISTAILTMALVARMVAGMNEKELLKGIVIVGLFGGIIVGLIAATKLAGKDAGKIGLTMLAIAGAIGILALISAMLGFIKIETLVKGMVAVGLLSAMMSLMIVATRGASECKGNLIAMAIAIGVMAAAVAGLSLIDTSKLASTTLALTMLMSAFALMTKASSGSKGSIGTLIAITGVVVLLAGVLYLLSTLKIEATMGATASLTLLMLSMSVVVAILSKFSSSAGKAVAGAIALAAMAIPLLAFVGALALMNGMSIDSKNIATLVALATTMTLLLIPLSTLGSLASSAFLGVLALTAMAVPLLAFVGVMAVMQNVQVAMDNVKALAILATTMGLVLIPLTLIGTFAVSALLGVLALTLMAVPLLAFVGVLALMDGVQNGITNARALTELMTAIGDVLFKISLVAPLAAIGAIALTAMIGLMVTLGILATAIGALVTNFPQLQEFLNTGIPIMVQLASGLGQIIGSFITAFAGEVMTILPQLGTCLSDFMTNATTFINGAKAIDDSVLAGVGALSAAIILLTAADLIAGVLSFMQGGSTFADLGTQLSQFMDNAAGFISGASKITPEMTEGIRNLADTILILTAANVIEGLASFITGGSSLEKFAFQLPLLGQGMALFAASLGTFSEDQVTTINCAANAIKTLAQASSEIPNAGGLLGMIVGENDLSAFAAQFPVLGTGLRGFLTNVGEFTDAQVATINCAASAIKTLAQASSEIPNAGGLLGMIVGENDLGTFAEQFPVLGSGLRGFLDNVGEFTEAQVATVDCAANAIKALAKASSEIPNAGGLLGMIVGENDLGTFAEQFPVLGTGLRDFLDNVGTFTDAEVVTIDCAARAVTTLANVADKIPNSGGFVGWIVGENDLGTFAEQFPLVGDGLKKFVDNIGTFTDAQVTTVKSAISAIVALTALANADLSGASRHLDDFGEDLPGFASDVGKFCKNMPDSSSMTTAVSNLDKLLSAVEDIGNANSGCLSTFADNLKSVGKKAVTKFVEAFTDSSVKTDLKDAAKKLGDQVIDGIESKESKIKSAGKNAAKEAVDGVETQEDDMESAGKDLGSGLVRGIKAKWDAAYSAGYTLGKKAVQGEKDGQQSKSPSKLTILAGKWIGEGLVIGMAKMSRQVYDAGFGLGKTATSTISSAVSRIADVVNTDIDSQFTIRPVLDLSDVRSGVDRISGMLSGANSIDVRARIGAISDMMNARGQNGANTDVVSAIDKLRKELGNINSNTYTINGVTISEGSDAADAIHSLVRVVRLEGRS